MDELAPQVLRLALPLILAALSETVAERGGVVNLGIEGMMLAGAFAAWAVAADGGAAALPAAWLVAGSVGAALGALSACFVVLLRADQIVTGTAIHFLCFGSTGLLFARWQQRGSATTFSELGPLLGALPYAVTVALAAGLAAFLFRTGAGLRLRAAGEAPEALRVAGGSPARSRSLALLAAGALAGLAGATLTTVLTGEFVEGMTGGRGFLALSLVIFARWTPAGAVLAGLFLGACFTLELNLSTFTAAERDSPARDALVLAVRALPYLLCVAVLAAVGRSRLQAPAALGRPH